MTTVETILQVALNRPLSQVFDYLPPTDCAAQQLRPGVRLRVPFGRGSQVGVLLGVVDHSELPPARLRRAESVLDAEPLLDAGLLRLARRAAEYYHHPIGEVVMALLPPLLRAGEAVPGTEEPRWFVSPAPDPARLARAPLQARLLEQLRRHPLGCDAGQLRAVAPGWRVAAAALVEKGLAEVRATPVDACEHGHQTLPPPELNPDQARVVAEIGAASGFQCFLLQGVTGSGKTEVYLRLIRQQLDRGRQSLLLVPEIGLTPQLIERLRQRLDTAFVVLHSGLNETERARAWQQAASGTARVVLGTRSAIFTPLPEPGLILIDEEHDTSFKQQEGFRYNARDLAILRASQLGITVVLGSATPALESLRNARDGSYRLLELRERAGGARPPRLALMDLRGRRLHGALADTLVQPIRRHLQSGSQVMLFLNRRGFAPVLICHECGWTADCERCDAHMTLHRGSGRLRCHHCGAERPAEETCGGCGHSPLMPVGKGTERIEADLRELFNEARVLRVDRDTTRRKGALQDLLEQIHEGSPALLVGTQMIGKGHHFPHVTLVVVLDADRGLYGLDFRASEIMAQTITQVAGRAGRAEKPGEVLIATHAPDHPALRELVSKGYAAFAEALLQERRQAELPPYTHLALIRAESHDRFRARDFLESLRTQLTEWGIADLLALGPAAAPIERLAGRYRSHLLLQSTRRPALHQALQHLRPLLEASPAARRLRWSIDVDPVDMM